MKKNVLAKFREFWETLSTDEQKCLWIIFTALRGEDQGDTRLKFFTTARIRGELLRTTNWYGCFMCPTLKDAKGEAYSRGIKKQFKGASSHWKSHIQSAIRVLLQLHPHRARDLKKFLSGGL